MTGLSLGAVLLILALAVGGLLLTAGIVVAIVLIVRHNRRK